MFSRLIRPLGLSLCIAAAATAQLAVSSPSFLPGGATPGASPGHQQGTAMAGSDDGTVLVVWSDARTSVAGGVQTDFDILGMRLDDQGQRLDPMPFVIGGGFGYQREPLVSWNGQNWLVMWEAQVPTQSYFADEARAVRVSKQGQVLDSQQIAPFGAGASGSTRHLCANGSTWLAVTEGAGPLGDTVIIARRIAADGSLAEAAPVVIVPAYLFAYEIESAGGEYLLTSLDINYQIRGRRFSATLAPVGAPFTLPGTDLTSNGTGYYLTWLPDSNEKRGSPLSVSGVLAIPNGAVLSASPWAWNESGGTWDGTQWWIGWADGFYGLSYSRVTAAGVVLDPEGIKLDTVQKWWMTGFRFVGLPGGGMMLGWQEYVGSPLAVYQAYASRVDSAGVASPRIVPGVSAPSQMRADVVRGGTGALVTFLSKAATTTDIVFQRLDGAGAVLDVEPIVLHTGNNVGAPRAAFNGEVFLVVWADNGTVYGKRVRPDGSVIDAAPLLAITGFSPDVAAIGDTFCVVGAEVGFSPEYVFPWALLVGGDGQVLTEKVTLGNSYASVPRVEAVGNRFLAVWQRNYSHDDPQGEADGAFIDLGGTATPSFVIAYNGFVPEAAVSPSEVMVVFRTNSTANANNDVAFRRMLPDGTLPTAQQVLSAAPYRQMFPTVAWTGSEFIATWEDQRNAITFYDVRTDVYGARISAAGQLLDPNAFVVEDVAAGASRPALAALSGVVYSATGVYLGDAPFASVRMSLRTIDDCSGGLALLGQGCAGSGGFVPQLVSSGCTEGNGWVDLSMSNALGGTTAFMVLGGPPVALNLKGACTLYAPPVSVTALSLLGSGPGAGHVLVSGRMPPGLPASTLTTQFVVLDPGTPKGITASNAIVLTLP